MWRTCGARIVGPSIQPVTPKALRRIASVARPGRCVVFMRTVRLAPVVAIESSPVPSRVRAMTSDSPVSVFFDLPGEVEIPVDGTLSRVIYRDEQIRVVVFAFDQGQELTDHTAAKPAIVQVVSGRIRLDFDGDPVELGPGSWVRMAAHLTHAVLALEPTVMMLTLLGANTAP